jgi:hypothetical protein
MSDQSDGAAPECACAEGPFIFGVSGHRDLARPDLPELRRQLEKVFARFAAAYPNAAFELWSPLAEGADQLAAEVALAHGIKVIVPLPMSQPEYERDFETAESLAEFRRLLARAESQFEVADSAGDSSLSLSLSDPIVRTEKYAALGDFIARKSHVLILLWDGSDNQKVGGTAWVKKRREHWEKLGAEEMREGFGYAGTVHIVTPREGVARMGLKQPRVETVSELPSPRKC